MAEFNLSAFTQRLRDMIYNSFPYEREEVNEKKHEDRPGHIRDVAFKNNQTIQFSDNELIFEIGNAFAEERYPYYHILQDTPYIRKRDRGTKKTKGSQAAIEYKASRDYGRVNFNGKTYTKEYRRNVRGERNRLSKVSHWATDYNGNRYFINKERNSYLNVHYNFIEQIMYFNLPLLALEFGLKQKRTQITGLEEEYKEQSYVSQGYDIVDIFNSFAEE